MKKIFTFLFLFTLILGFSVKAYAELFNRGTDINGNRLIYDSDLNITWYDYTNSPDTWQTHVNWADALSVTFGSNTYTDWRLPSTVDGLFVSGYDGTTTAGYNITSSEMGHLYYTELGNKGFYDTSGNLTGCDSSWPYSCLKNTGDFQHLRSGFYWSGTEYAATTKDDAWVFGTSIGYQTNINNYDYYALAVHTGDVTVVPEPVSTILFLSGGVILIGRKYIIYRRLT